MNAARKKAEAILYKCFDKFDKTGQNSAFYKAMFAKMSDAEFKKFMSRPFPIIFQYKLFDVEPTATDILEGLRAINVPLTEHVNLPYLDKNEDGTPVQTMECIVGPLPIKKMKQFLTKKTGWSTNINSRDMRTGLLISHDKNGNASDRELESLQVSSMDITTMELAGPRADEMNSKNVMYNNITSTGRVSLKDLPREPADSLSRNMLDAYLIGSCFKSNLVTPDYHLYKTLHSRNGIVREV